jgi:ParB-like chromosome segregation protein Spo0J
MNPILHIENIPLSRIDFADFTFSVSPEPVDCPGDPLIQSIARNGILHPPIVLENRPNLFAIVAGRKRLQVLRSLRSANTAACLVVPPGTPEEDIFLLLLEEIQLTRQLTTVERAIFLQKIAAFADTSRIVKGFLPRLGLAPHASSIKQALQLFDLEEPVLRSLHQGQLHETVAHDFIAMAPPDRMALFKIITSLRLSFSYQKKLLTMCRELASRSNTKIAALLSSNEVRAILQHQDANPPQKTKHLMLWLQNRHMPRSRQATEEFDRFINALQLPGNVSVTHTPYFEDDAITLSITFQDRKSLQQSWDKIRQAAYPDEN